MKEYVRLSFKWWFPCRRRRSGLSYRYQGCTLQVGWAFHCWLARKMWLIHCNHLTSILCIASVWDSLDPSRCFPVGRLSSSRASDTSRESTVGGWARKQQLRRFTQLQLAATLLRDCEDSCSCCGGGGGCCWVKRSLVRRDEVCVVATAAACWLLLIESDCTSCSCLVC